MSDLGITPSQAHYVLSRMVTDRKVTRRDVASYLSLMQKEINELEQKLEELRSLRSGGAMAASRGKRSRKEGKAPAAKAKKAKITPEQRASRKLQGVYMSLLRRFPKGKRAQYQRLVKEKDRQSAVDAMKAALGT